MGDIITKNPQFIYSKNEQTGQALIYCTRPVQFKAFIFTTPNNSPGFSMLPEKDTLVIRKIMKRMHSWFVKWHFEKRDFLTPAK